MARSKKKRTSKVSNPVEVPFIVPGTLLDTAGLPRADEYRFLRSNADSRDYLGMVGEVILEKSGVRIRLRLRTGFSANRELDPSVSITLPPSALNAIAAYAATKQRGQE